MLLSILLACNGGSDTGTPATTGLDTSRADALSMERVKAHVDLLGGDDFAGRTPGSEGHAAARDYLHAELLDMGLPPIGAEDYIHEFPLALDAERYTLNGKGEVVPINAELGQNLAAVVPGTDPELADEYIVLMAHYLSLIHI